MISKVIFKKLVAVSLMGSMSVGYVAYEHSLGDAKDNAGANEQLMEKISMFSTSYVSNGSKKFGYGAEKNDRKSASASDGTSLTGRAGAYSYSRVGKAYKYD